MLSKNLVLQSSLGIRKLILLISLNNFQIQKKMKKGCDQHLSYAYREQDKSPHHDKNLPIMK